MTRPWLDQLSERTGEKWPALFAARATTNRLVAQLRGGLEELEDPNYSIVVTGSLGRGEASHESDVDWFLLVDGLSNPDHTPVRQKIAERIQEIGLEQPGHLRMVSREFRKGIDALFFDAHPNLKRLIREYGVF